MPFNFGRVTRELQAVRLALGISGADSQAAIAPVLSPAMQMIYPGIGGMRDARRSGTVSAAAGVTTVTANTGGNSMLVPRDHFALIRAWECTHTDAANATIELRIAGIGSNVITVVNGVSVAAATPVSLGAAKPVIVFTQLNGGFEALQGRVTSAAFGAGAVLTMNYEYFVLPDSCLFPVIL